MMSRRKAIGCSLLCLVLLLNIFFALYLFCLERDDAQIRSAYLERAYFIYSNEIYPTIRDVDLRELYANRETLASNVDFRVDLGLNSLSSPGRELYRVCVGGRTSLYEAVDSMVRKMYLIVDPGDLSGPVFDLYTGVSEEELLDPEGLLNRVKRENQALKDALDKGLEAGNGYIEAFGSIEPRLSTW